MPGLRRAGAGVGVGVGVGGGVGVGVGVGGGVGVAVAAALAGTVMAGEEVGAGTTGVIIATRPGTSVVARLGAVTGVGAVAAAIPVCADGVADNGGCAIVADPCVRRPPGSPPSAEAADASDGMVADWPAGASACATLERNGVGAPEKATPGVDPIGATEGDCAGTLPVDTPPADGAGIIACGSRLADAARTTLPLSRAGPLRTGRSTPPLPSSRRLGCDRPKRGAAVSSCPGRRRVSAAATCVPEKAGMLVAVRGAG